MIVARNAITSDEFSSNPLYSMLGYDSITELTANLPASSLMLDESSSETEDETEDPDDTLAEASKTVTTIVSQCFTFGLSRLVSSRKEKQLNAELEAMVAESELKQATSDTAEALASRGEETLTRAVFEQRLAAMQASMQASHEKEMAKLRKRVERSNTSGRSTGQGSKADNSEKPTDNGSSNSSNAKSRKRNNNNRRGKVARDGRGSGAQHGAARRS